MISASDAGFASVVGKVIEKEFPDYRQKTVVEMLEKFTSLRGKAAALSALLRASTKNGKLGDMIEWLHRYLSFWECDVDGGAPSG